MFVEEFNSSIGATFFRYKIGNNEFEDAAGVVLCELLNSDICCLLYDYQCFLHSGEDKFRKRVENKYYTFSPTLQNILKDIFPINSHNIAILEEINDLIGVISSKIASNDASYDFFIFALTNFYGYKPPISPIRKYKVSFLGFICPLIENYIPFIMHTDEYKKLITEINESDNIPHLQELLLKLEQLIEQEFVEQNDVRIEAHCKNIRNIIMGYCLDIQKYDYLPYDIENEIIDMNNEQYELLYSEQFAQLNSDTDLIMIQRICEETFISYKPFFIDLLYSYNNKNSNTYYLKNVKELISHALLYCFKGNQLPIKQCKYCKKYYIRHQNSQTVCLSCRGLTSSMTKEEQIKVFGSKIDDKLTLLYKKLCYSTIKGKHTLNRNKYTLIKDENGELRDLLNEKQSQILVDSFTELISDYKSVGRKYIERYQTLPDTIVQKDFADYVKSWLKTIEEYYTFNKIKGIVERAKASNPENPIVIIKKYLLDGIQVEEKEFSIPLYK